MKSKFSILWALLILGLVLLTDLRLIAAPPTPPAPSGVDTLAGSTVDSDSLILQNRLIVVFRANVMGYSPAERRQRALRRIIDMIKAGEADSVRALPIPQGMMISIGTHGVFAISPADIDSLAGETLAATSQRAVENLAQALQEEMQQRSFSHLLTAVALIILATIALALLLWATRRGHRYLDERLQRAAAAGIS